MKDSYWILSSENNTYETLNKDEKIDCLIVGSGIVGLTTAYLLAKENRDVIIVDADKVGWGTSGRNTGKVTSQHGLIYDAISKKHSPKKARMYYDANEEGIKLVENIVSEYNISCDLKKVPSFVYTLDENYVQDIKNEYETCKELKIPCDYYNNITGIPLDIKGALCFKDQIQFHPKKYVDQLAKINKKLGVKIYENTSIVDIKTEEKCLVKTSRGYSIECNNLIVASSNPWYDGLRFYFAKEEASRSYLICTKLKEGILAGNYINVEEPRRTFRNYEDEYGQKYLIIGGQDHKTGKCDNEGKSYEIIEDYAKNNFKIGEVLSKWSAQDYLPYDEVPYLGRINSKQNNIYIVTGTNKWGLSNGSVGAIIIRDLITKNSSKYEQLYNPSRAKSYLNAKFIKSDIEMAYDYIKGKINLGDDKLSERDEGKIVNIDGKRYGAYRDEEGHLYVVDITCTHLGCELRFNSAEKSWDCPCHGSRFDFKGNILNGPALNPLKCYGEGENHINPKIL
ncbi:FAD-dependent oxidoreductase [Terrisporobacter sp.]